MSSDVIHSSSIARSSSTQSTSQSAVLPYFASEDVDIIPLPDKTRCEIVRGCAREITRDVTASLWATAASLWQSFYEHCSVVYFTGSPT